MSNLSIILASKTGLFLNVFLQLTDQFSNDDEGIKGGRGPWLILSHPNTVHLKC